MNKTLLRRIDSLLPHDLRRLAFRLRHPETFLAWQAMRTGADPKGYTFEPFDRHRCIFIHVPKCAGVSMSRALFGNLAGGHRKIETYRLVFSREEFTSYFKFAFVRNPWDRLLSAFCYLKEGGFNAVDRQWADHHLRCYRDFRGFVTRWVTRENVWRWPHFMPQTHFLCIGGRVAVDFIGYFERLSEDFVRVRDRLRINASLPNVNQSNRPHEDYRNVYDDEMRGIVADVYADDIATLGYRFGGLSPTAVTLPQRTAA